MIIDGLHIVIVAIYILHIIQLQKKLREEREESASWRQSTMELNAKLHIAQKQTNILSNGSKKVA